jgi:hypothetical protein
LTLVCLAYISLCIEAAQEGFTVMIYTVEAATELAPGVTISSRRIKVSGFFVVNPQGRRVRAFTGKDAEQKAQEWAKILTERLDD